jgi:hypothetical protein
MGLSSRTRVIERPALATRDFDAAGVAAPLAWLANDQFLAWNRSSHRVERQSLTAPLGATAVTLPTEPGNATISGDILITSQRGNDGRTTVAHSLSTGEQLWQHVDAKTFVVRCADDRHEPCFAIRVANAIDQIHRIDPATGALGDVVYEGPRLEDVAVDDAGTRLAIASTTDGRITLLALATGAQDTVMAPVTAVRSLAFEHDGSLLIGGTLSRNIYSAYHLSADGTFDLLAQTENDILSMIRPSPDASRVLMLSRSYAPSVWQIR